jgi:hypothetical protein
MGDHHNHLGEETHRMHSALFFGGSILIQLSKIFIQVGSPKIEPIVSYYKISLSSI